jgi:hypothetical protein
MYSFRKLLMISILFAALLPLPVPGSPDEGLTLSTPSGGIAFEVVGQVTNFPPAGPGQPATSQQYGYLSLVNGLTADQIFSSPVPTSQNEATALFTFFTDATTERVISNGRLRVVNRTGTTTIYFDQTPDGDFSNRDSFRDGTAVLTMAYRQQVILDTGEGNSIPGTGTFTVMNLLTVTDVQRFEIGGESVRLARLRDQFKRAFSLYLSAQKSRTWRSSTEPGPVPQMTTLAASRRHLDWCGQWQLSNPRRLQLAAARRPVGRRYRIA